MPNYFQAWNSLLPVAADNKELPLSQLLVSYVYLSKYSPKRGQGQGQGQDQD